MLKFLSIAFRILRKLNILICTIFGQKPKKKKSEKNSTLFFAHYVSLYFKTSVVQIGQRIRSVKASKGKKIERAEKLKSKIKIKFKNFALAAKISKFSKNL